MEQSRVALVDCNHFYAACERVFDPSLWGKPVVVLTNNDIHVISLTPEAKALGIPRGEPLFKLRHLVRQHDVRVFSSNYALYGDLSHRVMTTLGMFAPEVEVYSIDEAFLDLTGIPGDMTEYGTRIRSTVMQHTGIPVSVGIAPTKTLAKLANKLAKKSATGVFDMCEVADMDRLLASVPVRDVWGVGGRHARRLEKMGVMNARQLRDMNDRWVRQHMSVVGLRLVHELRGIPCNELDIDPDPKKGILTSKSFGYLVSDYQELREALATYVTRAAEKLRGQGSIAGYMQVFICTNPYRKEQPQYSKGSYVVLDPPTAYTPLLLQMATKMLKDIYRPGYQYKKAGVMFNDILQAEDVQLDAFRERCTDSAQERLMQAVDAVNGKFGADTLRYGVAGFTRKWNMRRQKLSPRYTTSWDELPTVRS